MFYSVAEYQETVRVREAEKNEYLLAWLAGVSGYPEPDPGSAYARVIVGLHLADEDQIKRLILPKLCEGGWYVVKVQRGWVYTYIYVKPQSEVSSPFWEAIKFFFEKGTF